MSKTGALVKNHQSAICSGQWAVGKKEVHRFYRARLLRTVTAYCLLGL